MRQILRRELAKGNAIPSPDNVIAAAIKWVAAFYLSLRQFSGNALLDFNSQSPSECPDSVVLRERQSLSTGGIIAWCVIALVTLTMVYLTIASKSLAEQSTVASKGDLFPVQMQGKVFVGQRELAGAAQAEQLETLDTGTYEQRLGQRILVNELLGSEAAAEQLKELDEEAEAAEFEATEEQQELRDSVGQLIEAQADGSFDEDVIPVPRREQLTEMLGWIGELALVPSASPDTTDRKVLLREASTAMFLMIGATGIVMMTMFVGLIGLVLVGIMFGNGKIRTWFATQGQSANIYLQTFAIWMMLFFGCQVLLGLGLRSANIEMGPANGLIVTTIIFLGSLVVLVYPVIRGVPVRQMLRDIGWIPRTPVIDTLIAPATYAMTITVLITAVLVFAIGIAIFGPLEAERPFGTSIAPGHPIQDYIAQGDPVILLLVFVTAAIVAPIVEETMFRGVLYRHLREWSGHWRLGASVAFSAVANGLIFAAIHPQGLIAVPLLTTLAIGFSLAREWRDSLVAPMIMHGINNGALTCLMFMFV